MLGLWDKTKALRSDDWQRCRRSLGNQSSYMSIVSSTYLPNVIPAHDDLR